MSCLFLGDEMFTDALPVTETEDKCFFRVKGKVCSRNIIVFKIYQ